MSLLHLIPLLFILFLEFVALQGCDPLRDANDIRVMAAEAQIQAIVKAMRKYENDVGLPLNNIGGLESLVVRPAFAPGWRGPYLRTIPRDPWGHEYILIVSETPRVLSYGADGKPGGIGANADIVISLTKP
jgi:general secretion pathway protein G